MSSGSTAHKFQLREKAQLMSTPEMDRTLARLAHEIVEKNSGGEDMAFVGIRRRGVPLAERLGRMASRIENKHIRVGRTIRAAIEALFFCGRPARVQLCVLIDRGHRELPIEAAYVGRAVPTTMREVIEVKVNEIDGIEKVLLLEK